MFCFKKRKANIIAFSLIFLCMLCSMTYAGLSRGGSGGGSSGGGSSSGGGGGGSSGGSSGGGSYSSGGSGGGSSSGGSYSRGGSGGGSSGSRNVGDSFVLNGHVYTRGGGGGGNDIPDDDWTYDVGYEIPVEFGSSSGRGGSGGGGGGNNMPDENWVYDAGYEIPVEIGDENGGPGVVSGGSGGGNNLYNFQNKLQNNINDFTIIQSIKETNTFPISSHNSTWKHNDETGKWMLIASINNNNIVACNGFISIDFKDTYYFDTYGNMVTGWVQDASGSRYYFEPNNSADQGKMYTGTKMIDGKIYNFDANGKLVS